MASGRAPRSMRAVVVHTRPLGEADRIIECLTPEVGRVDLVARGVRGTRQRFFGPLDLFVSADIEAVSGASLWRLQSAVCTNLRPRIRADLQRIAAASLLAETVHTFCAKDEPAERDHRLLEKALDALDGPQPHRHVAAFPRWLHAWGLLPRADRCAQCQRPLTQFGAWQPQMSGIECPDCSRIRASERSAEVLQVFCGHACADEKTAALVQQCMLTLLEYHHGSAFRCRTLLTHASVRPRSAPA